MSNEYAFGIHKGLAMGWKLLLEIQASDRLSDAQRLEVSALFQEVP